MTYNEVLRVVLAVMVKLQPILDTTEHGRDIDFIWLNAIVKEIKKETQGA